MVNGIAQKPIEGVSMDYTFDRGNANAPSTRTTQYFEMFGNRAIYHEGWIAATTPPAPPWLLGTAKLPDVVDGYKWDSITSQTITLSIKQRSPGGGRPTQVRKKKPLRWIARIAKNSVFIG
jgi:hypothetical protein